MSLKPRVYELAKEFGVTSRELLTVLREQCNEFVTSAATALEPPVVRRLREIFPTGREDDAGGGPPASGAADD